MASTSFMFMLVWVPEPVCHTTSGNSASCIPASTSSAAATIASAVAGSSAPSARFTVAQARLTSASARTSSGGIRSPEIRKCCSERCVCAPHRRAAGTSISPKLSRSIRTSVDMAGSWESAELNNNPRMKKGPSGPSLGACLAGHFAAATPAAATMLS